MNLRIRKKQIKVLTQVPVMSLKESFYLRRIPKDYNHHKHKGEELRRHPKRS